VGALGVYTEQDRFDEAPVNDCVKFLAAGGAMVSVLTIWI
jgi:hypothetical protein